jgi:hypothetical protein
MNSQIRNKKSVEKIKDYKGSSESSSQEDLDEHATKKN